jgi:hypothetical protein
MITTTKQKIRHIVGRGKNAHWIKWNGTQWVYDGKAYQVQTPSASPASISTPSTPIITQGMTRDQKIYYDFSTQGNIRIADIAKEYNLSSTTIRQIIYRQGKLQAASYGQQVPAKYGDKQGVVEQTFKDVSIEGKLSKKDIYEKLSPEDKKRSDMAGVLGADPQALSYIKENFEDIFGKSGDVSGGPIPKYISKIKLTNLDSVYGTRMGWTFRGDDLWDELETKAGVWSGLEEEDKALANLGRRTASLDSAVDTSLIASRRVFDALTPILGNRPYEVRLGENYEAGHYFSNYGEAFFKEHPEAKEETNYSKQADLANEWKKKCEEIIDPIMKGFDPIKHSIDDMYSLRSKAIQVLVDWQYVSEEYGQKQMQKDSSNISKHIFRDLDSYQASHEEYVASLAWLKTKEPEFRSALRKPVTQAITEISDLMYSHISEHKEDFDTLVKRWSGKEVTLENHTPYNDIAIAAIIKSTGTSTSVTDNLMSILGPRVRGLGKSGLSTSLFREYMRQGDSNRLRPSLSTLASSTDVEMKCFAEYMAAQSGVSKLRSYLSRTQGSVSVLPMSRKDWRKLGGSEARIFMGSGTEVKRRKRAHVFRNPTIVEVFSDQDESRYHRELMSMRQVFYVHAMKGKSESNDKFVLRSVDSNERKKIVEGIDQSWDKQEHGGMHYRIKGVFAIDSSPGEKKFKATKDRLGGKTKTLYHGTHFAAACAISRDQFRVGKAKVGRMLGDGVYFAENSSKSAQYLADSGFSRHGTHGILFAAEVATGKEDFYENAASHNTSGNTMVAKKGIYVAGRTLRNTEYAIKDPTQAIPRYWIDVEVA